MKRYLSMVCLVILGAMLTGCTGENSAEVSKDVSVNETSEVESLDTENSDTENSETETSDTETSDTESSETENLDTEVTETEGTEEYMDRLMTADLSKAKAAEGMDDWNTIVRLAELPKYDITVYGYNDEEYHDKGVAVRIGEDINCFDWMYITPKRILPEIYWDDTKKQLQVELNIYSGTGIACSQLHVLQQYETGTLIDVTLDQPDYSELLSERLDFAFEEETQILTLIDTKNNNEITQVDLSMMEGIKIGSVSAGEIADFQLGEQIWLTFVPSYAAEGSVSPLYDGMPQLKVAVELQSAEDGSFGLGDKIVVETENQ